MMMNPIVLKTAVLNWEARHPRGVNKFPW